MKTIFQLLGVGVIGISLGIVIYYNLLLEQSNPIPNDSSISTKKAHNQQEQQNKQLDQSHLDHEFHIEDVEPDDAHHGHHHHHHHDHSHHHHDHSSHDHDHDHHDHDHHDHNQKSHVKTQQEQERNARLNDPWFKFYSEKNKVDPFSFSNLNELKTVHFYVEGEIDVDQQLFFGSITLFVSTSGGTVNQIYLDTQFLDISKVLVNEKDSQFKILKTNNQEIGDQLYIKSEQGLEHEKRHKINITFSTTKNCTALSWMSEKTTFSRQLKFIFTQCETIHCRSLIPFQDSPSSQTTYTAQIKIKQPYTVYMSASIEDVDTTSSQTHNVFYFTQKIPIPSYTFAFTAGDLEREQISERVYLITEKGTFDQYKDLFKDTELYLKTIEEYVGPFQWPTLEMLVTPNSFPYLGMENPQLTMISPAGIFPNGRDNNVLIHEIVHMWIGNTVTCSNWNYFWLNEGMTVFIQREILQKLYGEEVYQLHSYMGRMRLEEFTALLGEDPQEPGKPHPMTALTPGMENDNLHPDEAVTLIPYEKGFLYFTLMQRELGDRIPRFIQSWVVQRGDQPSSSGDLVGHISSFLFDQFNDYSKAREYLGKVHIFQMSFPGQFSFHDDFNFFSNFRKIAQKVAQKIGNTTIDLQENEIINLRKKFNDLPVKGKVMTLLELDNYQQNPELIVQRARQVLEPHNFELDQILSAWTVFVLKNQVVDQYFVQLIVSKVGRIVYLQDIYKNLYSISKDYARLLFEQNKERYHPIAINIIRKIISD